MAKNPERALTEPQMEIMQCVWDAGVTTVGEVWRRLNEVRPIARNTVQTTMTRLEKRGWLKSTERDGKFHYRAVQSREKTLRGMVGRFVEGHFADRPEGLIMALLEGRGLSAEESDRIRALLDDSEGGDE